mmetsp:Transcript_4014/g.5275  ORF Transcript_4014/g.5275 Transcript_4014/m.5275 type:complete len:105 (-) Transcript_4014:182-496(-)
MFQCLCRNDIINRAIFDATQRSYGFPLSKSPSVITELDLTAYGRQLCEVKPNCYWSPIDEGEDLFRSTVYSQNYRSPPNTTRVMDVVRSEEVLNDWASGFILFV